MSEQADVIELVKDYIPDSRYCIKLDALVTREIRKYLQGVTEEHFPLEALAFSQEEFARRLHQYVLIIQDLQSIVTLLSHWGSTALIPILRKIISRVSEQEYEVRNGIAGWLDLRWYPSLLLLYSGGIAAIASDNYGNLATLLATRVESRRAYKLQPVIVSVFDAMEGLTNAFKLLPGYERQHVARSNSLFDLLRPHLDALLFLGQSYETLFDRFEVFFSLVYADLHGYQDDRIWAPLGRFALKPNGSALIEIVEEAKAQGQNWLPLRAGLFGGSFDRFQQIALKYGDLVSRRQW
jgi:hypothetical protein